MRWLATSLLAIALGVGHAYADTAAPPHDGGKLDAAAYAEARANSSADTRAKPAYSGRSDAAASTQASAIDSGQAGPKVSVSVEEEGIGTDDWTRTVTRTVQSESFIRSVTRSFSYAYNEDGDRAIAVATATARAPVGAVAVMHRGGSIVAETSVAVTGDGIASAGAGGSISVTRDRTVKVSTWGETSAAVY